MRKRRKSEAQGVEQCDSKESDGYVYVYIETHVVMLWCCWYVAWDRFLRFSSAWVSWIWRTRPRLYRRDSHQSRVHKWEIPCSLVSNEISKERIRHTGGYIFSHVCFGLFPEAFVSARANIPAKWTRESTRNDTMKRVGGALKNKIKRINKEVRDGHKRDTPLYFYMLTIYVRNTHTQYIYLYRYNSIGIYVAANAPPTRRDVQAAAARCAILSFVQHVFAWTRPRRRPPFYRHCRVAEDAQQREGDDVLLAVTVRLALPHRPSLPFILLCSRFLFLALYLYKSVYIHTHIYLFIYLVFLCWRWDKIEKKKNEDRKNKVKIKYNVAVRWNYS